MDKNLIQYIKEKWDCVSYARLVLGLPIFKPGDRCKSWRPDAKRNDSLLVETDHFCDFGSGHVGDIIDMCAEAVYNGDKGKAIRELAGDKFSSKFQDNSYQDYIRKLEEKISYWHAALRTEDYEYLHSRRITNETINRLMLGYSANQQRLTIPYWKNGHYVYYAGRDRSGNPNASKYKKAFIDDYNENCPWGLHSLNNPKHQGVLCVLEGVFDAMSFEQEGYAVLSPIGGYFSKSQTQTVLTAAKNFDYVFVLFDSDNPGLSFQKKMAQVFFSHRIKFKCGILPTGIKDVSDYYTAGGDLDLLVGGAVDGVAFLARTFDDKDEFAKFMTSAARYVKKYDITEAIIGAKQFPVEWRKALIQECTKAPAESLIVESLSKNKELKFIEASGFFEYSHGVWLARPDNLVKNYIADELGNFATGARLSSILGFVKARRSSQEVFNTQNVFNFLNGVLNLETGKIESHSPSFMSTVQADFDYDPKADCPRFKHFINEVMCGENVKMNLLQEMCGYILYPDCSLQKCFFLMGDGSNGKSVLLNTLASVFGKGNCSYVDISSLIGPFDPIRLRYSLVNFSNETRSNIKEADEKFKAVIAGDPISAANKGKDAIEFISRAKWICAANNYISANDVNYSMIRRIVFIRFERTFKGAEIDPNLTEKLIAEKQGIFNWIYKGYLNLKEQGAFSYTNEQQELLDEFMQSISPTAAFFDDELANIFDDELDTETIYANYSNWCKRNGNKAMNRVNFTRTIKQIIKQKRPDTTFRHSGSKYYVVFGGPQFKGGI